MSLINDALKKAQRERSGPATPPVSIPPTQPPGPPPARHAAPAKGSPWPIVLVALALVGGASAVWFLKPSAPAMPTVAVNTAPAAPATAAPATPPAEADQPPALQINLPGSSTSTPPPASAPAAPSPAAPAPVAPAAAPTPAPSAPAATEAPAAAPVFKVTLQMEDPRVLAFLDAARINGVRAVADDAKLLMNNKVFRPGAVVDRELGLKLIQILPTELVFEDSHGIQYRKSL